MRWTVQESNYCQPGSYIEVRVRPAAGGGSKLLVDWNRRGVGIKGKILITFVVLTRAPSFAEEYSNARLIARLGRFGMTDQI